MPKPFATPASLGYRMPAEWEPHEATWIAWPHNRSDWPGKFQPIPWIYADIVRVLASAERVHVLVQDAKAKAGVAAILEKAGVKLENVVLHVRPTDRVWTRDSGPIFLTRKGSSKEPVALCHFQFNAWAKYDNFKLDAKLPAFVAGQLKVRAFDPLVDGKRFVLEGGSIDVNGRGCVLTTEECLLSPVQQRNPGLSRGEVERVLCDYLGVSKVLWLDRGIAGDDTHGHVDDTARFAGPTTILTCVEPDSGDDNHGPMAENLRRLKAMRDVRGKPFDVMELPLPAPVVFEGQRLPASYANFYIANAGVLVPVFNDANDMKALKVIERAFPGRAVVPIYCRDLVWGLGTLHCMTQQQPAG